MGGADPSWKTSILAILGAGAVATLVAGELHAFLILITLDQPQSPYTSNCPLQMQHQVYNVAASNSYACCAGPIIATFLALAVGIGAVLSTSIAIMSVAWIIPAAAIFLSLGGLFVFPVALTLVSLALAIRQHDNEQSCLEDNNSS